MNPKNVAIIAGQLVVGGAERQLYLWLSHLDREKFRPIVVTLHPNCDDYWENPIESLGIQLLRSPRRHSQFGRLLDIIRLLHPYRPHLVHGWHLFSSPYAGIASRLLGAKASLGSLRSSFRSYLSQWTLSRLTERLADGILVNSRSVGEQLARSGRWPREKIHVVPNAVESTVEERMCARQWLNERWGIPESRIWVGSMGRFDPSKRFDLLLEVMAGLCSSETDTHLVLIGDGAMCAILKAKAKSLQIDDHVTFVGSDTNARYWLSALDIFCFLSTDEGLPNAVMEAAAAGVPVVSWRAPFLEELMKGGELAVLVEPENLPELRAALLELIRNPALCSRLGEAGRRYILDEYSTGRFVHRLTKVYEELLGISPAAVVEQL